jgi:hypothetical protein
MDKDFLDDDQLWYCCMHNLSVNKNDYTDYELQMIKLKALEEREKAKNRNHEKLQELLSK